MNTDRHLARYLVTITAAAAVLAWIPSEASASPAMESQGTVTVASAVQRFFWAWIDGVHSRVRTFRKSVYHVRGERSPTASYRPARESAAVCHASIQAGRDMETRGCVADQGQRHRLPGLAPLLPGWPVVPRHLQVPPSGQREVHALHHHLRRLTSLAFPDGLGLVIMPICSRR